MLTRLHDWWVHLSWSQAALYFIGTCLVVIVIADFIGIVVHHFWRRLKRQRRRML